MSSDYISSGGSSSINSSNNIAVHLLLRKTLGGLGGASLPSYNYFGHPVHSNNNNNQPSSSSSSSSSANLFDKRQLVIGSPEWDRARCIANEAFIRRMDKRAELAGHQGCVNTITFDERGEVLLSGSDDLKVIFWDWEKGEKRAVFDSGHRQNVFQARPIPGSNCRMVVTAAADGRVNRMQVREGGAAETQQLHKHSGRAHKLSLRPGCVNEFLSCGEDGDICHYDLRLPSPARVIASALSPNDYRLSLNTINFHPYSNVHFAIGGEDVQVQIFDLRKTSMGEGQSQQGQRGAVVRTFEPKFSTQPHSVTCIAWSQSGEQLIASYNDDDIYLFHWSQPADDLREKQVYQGHRNSRTVKGVNFFGPNSEYVVSGSDCGHVFFWRTDTGDMVQMLKGDKDVVNCLEPHPSLCTLATSGIENTVKIWEPIAEKSRHTFTSAERTIMQRNRNREGDVAFHNIFLRLLQRNPEQQQRLLELLAAMGEADDDDDEPEEFVSGDNEDEDDEDDDDNNPEANDY